MSSDHPCFAHLPDFHIREAFAAELFCTEKEFCRLMPAYANIDPALVYLWGAALGSALVELVGIQHTAQDFPTHASVEEAIRKEVAFLRTVSPSANRESTYKPKNRDDWTRHLIRTILSYWNQAQILYPRLQEAEMLTMLTPLSAHLGRCFLYRRPELVEDPIEKVQALGVSPSTQQAALAHMALSTHLAAHTVLFCVPPIPLGQIDMELHLIAEHSMPGVLEGWPKAVRYADQFPHLSTFYRMLLISTTFRPGFEALFDAQATPPAPEMARIEREWAYVPGEGELEGPTDPLVILTLRFTQFSRLFQRSGFEDLPALIAYIRRRRQLGLSEDRIWATLNAKVGKRPETAHSDLAAFFTPKTGRGINLEWEGGGYGGIFKPGNN